MELGQGIAIHTVYPQAVRPQSPRLSQVPPTRVPWGQSAQSGGAPGQAAQGQAELTAAAILGKSPLSPASLLLGRAASPEGGVLLAPTGKPYPALLTTTPQDCGYRRCIALIHRIYNTTPGTAGDHCL